MAKRPAGGEKPQVATDGILDISNYYKLGYTEVELLQQVIDGVKKLIELEKKLEKRENIDGIVRKMVEEMTL